ncbi:MAG: hypothetical protein V1848_00500 [Candidatus Magasanikbacteria bacterium]
MNIEIENLINEIISHAEKMRVPVDCTKRKCVDGGYKEHEAVGAIALPGADLGISMALLKLGFSPEEAFEIVHRFVTKSGHSYCWHTDTHEGHHGCIVGCGHCNVAIGKSHHYGVESEKIAELLNIVRRKQEELSNVDRVILDREHAEKAILVIVSVDYTVKPWDEQNNNQYFIYDQTHHENLLRDLVEHARSLGISLSFDDLLTASKEHTFATLGLLGTSKGKPMFLVDVSGEKPKVQYLQHVTVLE